MLNLAVAIVTLTLNHMEAFKIDKKFLDSLFRATYCVYSCTIAAIAVIQVLHFQVLLKNTSNFMMLNLRALVERVV